MDPSTISVLEWDIEQTAAFVTANNYRNIALQFPDDLLHHSTAVAGALKRRLGSAFTVAVLADTAFNPQAVDEVAAHHMNASCVVRDHAHSIATEVHYGHASLAAVSQLPVLYVFPRQRMHVRHTATAVAGALSSGCSRSEGTVVIILDQALMHACVPFEATLKELLHPQRWNLVMASVTVQSSQKMAVAGSTPQQPSLPASHDVSTAAAVPSAAPAAACTLPTAWTAQTGSCAANEGGCTEGAGSCCTLPGMNTCSSTAPTDQESQSTIITADQQQQQQQQQHPHVAGYTWRIPENTAPETVTYVWIGPQDSVTLQALQLALNTAHWVRVRPAEATLEDSSSSSSAGDSSSLEAASPSGECRVEEGLAAGTQALLRRRYFLVEKAKEASIVGILVGTLAVAGLSAAMAELRRLIRDADKKSYTMLMGKPNPAKLANFPEVEVWVQLADPLGFILDSKPYMAPIITPFEARLAFTGESLLPGTPYCLGLDSVLESAAGAGSTGARIASPGEDDEGDDNGLALVGSRMAGLTVSNAGGAGTLSVQGGGKGSALIKARDGAEFLAKHRTYKGLEAPVAGAEYKAPAAAVEGLAGRAAGYVQEPPVPAEQREW